MVKPLLSEGFAGQRSALQFVEVWSDYIPPIIALFAGSGRAAALPEPAKKIIAG
jgi:hypothetical protein